MRRGGPRAWRGLAIAGILVVLAAGGVFCTLRSGWIAETERAAGRVVALPASGRGYSPTVEFRPAGAGVMSRKTAGRYSGSRAR